MVQVISAEICELSFLDRQYMSNYVHYKMLSKL